MIEDAFVYAFNQILGDKVQYLARFEELLPLLADTGSLEAELSALQAEHDTRLDELRRYMEENTRRVQDQAEYSQRFSEMSDSCAKIEAKITQVEKSILVQQGRKEQIRRCLNELRQCEAPLTEFDLDLWNALIR